MNTAYKRVVIKLSGESLAGNKGFGFDFDTIMKISEDIKKIWELRVQIVITLGGGNFWRGRNDSPLSQVTSDNIGMISTLPNALALSNILENIGVPVCVFSTLYVEGITTDYNVNKAIECLQNDRIAIIACGVGKSGYTSDTAATLRAMEVNADIVLMAKNVDGIYDSDPKKFMNAKKYNSIRISELLEKRLFVIDTSAAQMCKDNGIKCLVFGINEPNCFSRIIKGEYIGTVVLPC